MKSLLMEAENGWQLEVRGNGYENQNLKEKEVQYYKLQTWLIIVVALESF